MSIGKGAWVSPKLEGRDKVNKERKGKKENDGICYIPWMTSSVIQFQVYDVLVIAHRTRAEPWVERLFRCSAVGQYC
jgi:hypothetical protein